MARSTTRNGVAGGNVYTMRHQWLIRGPVETVFRYVTDSRTFCNWFTVFRDVHPDDPDGPIRVGSHSTMRVKALLPYTLDWDVTVVRHEASVLQQTDVRVTLNGRFGMRGLITFRFEPQPDGTVIVHNEQELCADQPLPRFLKPLAAALFRFNHRWAMQQAQAPLQAIVAGASSR